MASMSHVNEKTSVNERTWLLNQYSTGMLTVKIAYLIQVEDINLALET